MSQQPYDLKSYIQENENLLEKGQILSIPEVDEYNRLAYQLRSTDLERAKRLCTIAESNAQQLQYVAGRAWSLLNKGTFLAYASKHDESFRLFLEAHTLFTEAEERQGIASALRWLGVMYTRVGGHVVALEHYLRSYDIGVETGDSEHCLTCLINIGAAHSALGDHTRALECFSQVLEMQDEHTEPLTKATLLLNTGRAYEGLNDLPKAFDCFGQSMRIRAEVGDRTGVAAAAFALGDVYLKMENPGRALRQYLMSCGICVEARFLWGEALCNHAIGALYIAHGKPEKALSYLERAVRQAEKVGNLETRSQAHLSLAKCFRALGQSDTAYNHILHYHSLKDEIDNGHLQQTVRYLQIGHETERTRREAEIFRHKNEELASAYTRLSDAFEEVKILNDTLATTNQQLTEINSEKNELLGIVAHDLKNPLTSIILSTSILQRYFSNQLPEAAVQEILGISHTAERMNDLIARLLNLNAMDSGSFDLTIENCDISRKINDLVREYQAQMQAKNITIHTDVASGFTVLADPDALTGIVDNLLSNAVKFSPVGKSIWLRLSSVSETLGKSTEVEAGKSRYVRLEVRDEGPGITDEDYKRLFTRFARLSARPTAGESSTGLGLSIVKKLTEAMGGSVECKNKAGAGATFIVELPAPA